MLHKKSLRSPLTLHPEDAIVSDAASAASALNRAAPCFDHAARQEDRMNFTDIVYEKSDRVATVR